VPTVNTLHGAIDVEQLGVTYMHEHVFVLTPEAQWHWPGYGGWDEATFVSRAHEKLKQLKDDGVDTILDPTVAGLGRHIRAVAAAAEGTGLQVIGATGYYIFNQLPFGLRVAKSLDEKIALLTELFMSDFENGMEGTGIKPGVLKCSTDADGVTEDVEAVLRAVARVHKATGLPITTHTDADAENGLDQQRIFAEEGVDLGAVVIGHCNLSSNPDYLEQLMDAGSYIGFDRCGMESEQAPRDAQVETLARLVRDGRASQIVLSHDHTVFVDAIPIEVYATFWPGFPYRHLQEGFLADLRARGTGEDAIRQMLVENPKAYFSRGSRA